jgi:hypothetical protein
MVWKERLRRLQAPVAISALNRWFGILGLQHGKKRPSNWRLVRSERERVAYARY